MRLSALICASLFLLPVALSGQDAPQPQQPVVQVADGGTSGRRESLFIPPMTNSPFSVVLVTEWSRPLGNVGNFSLANQRRIVRRGKGRVYQERWIPVPKDGRIPSKINVIRITDPAVHTGYDCSPDDKICELRRMAGRWRRITSQRSA